MYACMKGRRCDDVYWGDDVTKPREDEYRKGLLFFRNLETCSSTFMHWWTVFLNHIYVFQLRDASICCMRNVYEFHGKKGVVQC